MVTAALPRSSDRLPRRTNATSDHASQPLSCDLEDVTLARALASGEMAALDQLYQAYRPIAFAVAYALLQDACAAEDAVHDAFFRAWRNAASYQQARGSLRSWLLTIVRNTAIDQLRARGVAIRHQPRLQREAIAESDDDVSTTVSAAADATRLRNALQALPTAQRQALELAFFAGLTHGEIAARTGAPLGTVKGRVRLGLRRLRHDLADLSPEMMSEGQFPARAA
jgi:RNA polymerase sigma-70 factor (ECF subfamily)